MMTLASVVLCLTGTWIQEAPLMELQSAEVRDDGRTVDVEVGRLRLPQFHEDPERGELEVAVLVLPSTSSDPGAPIFFLNGIPEAATNLAGRESWDAYRELGDVVLLDQRGTGRSQPVLVWDRPPYRAELLLGQREEAYTNVLATGRAIRAFTSLAGVHPSAFNTRESARDVDRVRAALGYERIRLIGHSGGAHLGFEYLRQFGEHVERFASLGTAGPGEIHSLPGQLDAFVRELSERVASDERIGDRMPDLFGVLEEVLDQAEEQPFTVEVLHPETGSPISLDVGRHGLAFLIMLELGDPEELALLPRLLHELQGGRTELLTWFAQLRYRQLLEFPALLFVNRGASGATPERWARIHDEARASPFRDVRCLFFPELAEAMGLEDLGDAFRAPVTSSIPTLFLSGSLDGKTPPSRAETARAGFANSAHVVLVNGGHNDLIHNPDAHAFVLDFLSGRDLEDDEVVLPALPFALLEGEDPLVGHPALDG